MPTNVLKKRASDPWLERNNPRPHQFDAILPTDPSALIQIEEVSSLHAR